MNGDLLLIRISLTNLHGRHKNKFVSHFIFSEMTYEINFPIF